MREWEVEDICAADISSLLHDWAEVSGALEQAMEQLAPLQDKEGRLRAAIRGYVDKFGKAESAHARAWLSERKSISYDVETFRKDLPKFAPLCIEEIVNARKVKNLLKAKLITKEQLKAAEVVEIIKAFYLRRKK